MTKIIEIPNQEEEILILERASFEVSCRENIIKFMLKDGMSTSDEIYKNYWNEYILYSQAYEKLKKDFQNNVILKIMGEDFSGSWFVDFETKEVKIND